ncbi:MAG: acyltransferase [Bacteroidales bacterium]|nr:acyltransferase [Bacteroidales bacterium]
MLLNDSRPHYDILDGLRGVAALIVIVYHVFELMPGTPVPHGYLAVDFFFILSGFVIGYAYDGRWGEMTTAGFFKRRLIRLHPMVVAGAVLGALTFLIQGGVRWDGSKAGTGWVMLATLCAMLMIPAAPGMSREVRGNGEMFPLNGPSWSLFFEYIGNILYALLLRRLPKWALAVICAVSGVLLAWIAARDGFLGVGWSFIDGGFLAGMVRMLFPYSAGMLMARVLKPAKVRKTFIFCGLTLMAVAIIPAIGGQAWRNGLFEAFCVTAVFPCLVWLGASDSSYGERTKAVCSFLGDLSYPLYMVHYPVFYLFYHHIGFDGNGVSKTFAEVWPAALVTVAVSLTLAILSMRFYDRPVRKYLSSK